MMLIVVWLMVLTKQKFAFLIQWRSIHHVRDISSAFEKRDKPRNCCWRLHTCHSRGKMDCIVRNQRDILPWLHSSLFLRFIFEKADDEKGLQIDRDFVFAWSLFYGSDWKRNLFRLLCQLGRRTWAETLLCIL